MFCDFVFDHNLTHLVDLPTHVKGNTLDIVLTGSVDLVSNVRVSSSTCSFFDHSNVSFDISQVCSEFRHCNQSVYVFDFPKADHEGLHSALLDCDFELCYTSGIVEFVWSYISDQILSAIDNLIPKVRLKKNQRPKWISSSLQHQLNHLISCGGELRCV